MIVTIKARSKVVAFQPTIAEIFIVQDVGPHRHSRESMITTLVKGITDYPFPKRCQYAKKDAMNKSIG